MEENVGDEFAGVGWRPATATSPPMYNNQSHHPAQRWHTLGTQQQQPRQCRPAAAVAVPLNQRRGECPVAPTRPPSIASRKTSPPAPQPQPPAVVHYPQAPISQHFSNSPHLNTTDHFNCKSPLMMPNQNPPGEGWPRPWPSVPSQFAPSCSSQQPRWPMHQQPPEVPFSFSPSAAKANPIGHLAPPFSISPSSSSSLAFSSETIKRNQSSSRSSSRPTQHQPFTPQQKVQQWNLFGAGQIPRDSGVHSMSHSTANSVMSSVHHPLSCISAISSLPDDMSSLQDHPYFRHIPNGLRHEDPDKIREVLPELVPLINDDCEEVVLRALNIINGIAKKDKSRAPNETPLISEQKVVEGLLRTMRTHRSNKRVISYALRTLHFISDNEHSGRDLFARMIDADGKKCLEELVRSIAIPEHSCFKYAFLVLHNLISDQRLERRVIDYLCEMRTLTQMLGWLEDKNEKFLNIVTDIMQKLVTKSSEQMAFFIGLNGHHKLISLIANCRQEALLWRVVKLMDKIVQMDAERMVGCGLLEALQRHLDHPSQRLLRQVLSCIRSVSHMPTTNRAIQPLLQKLLQLLGTSDIRLKENCVDILANLCANNSQNKAFLLENGAVPSMFQLLYELDSVRSGGGAAAADDSFLRQLEGIQETALTLLKSLCTGPDDDVRVTVAKQHILHNDGHKSLLLDKLREWHFGLLRRTLLLLVQLANSAPPLLSQLRFFVTFAPRQFVQLSAADSSPVEQCSFASQIVLLIHQFVNMLPDSTELCRLCLDILQAMCRDRLLLEEIYSELRSRRIAEGQGPRLLIPQLLLCISEQLAPNAIFLLAELARIPEILQMMCRHSNTIEMLRNWADKKLEEGHNAKQQQRVQAVHKAFRLIQLIGSSGLIKLSGRAPAAQQSLFAAALVPAREELSSVGDQSQNRDTAMEGLSTETAASPVPFGDVPLPMPAQIAFPQSECPLQPPQLDNGTMLGNKEQLAQFGAFEEMQDLTLSGDDFTDDFGLFVNAFCPNSSPNWSQKLP